MKKTILALLVASMSSVLFAQNMVTVNSGTVASGAMPSGAMMPQNATPELGNFGASGQSNTQINIQGASGGAPAPFGQSGQSIAGNFSGIKPAEVGFVSSVPEINDKDVKATLKQVNQKRAVLELLKLETEILKAKEPFKIEDEKAKAAKKAEEDKLKAEMAAKVLEENNKKAAAEAAASAAAAATAAKQSNSNSNSGVAGHVSQDVIPTVSVLSIYGLAENLMATIKVDDMILNVKKGDKLPAGFVVRTVDSDFVGVSRGAKGKVEKLYVSGSDAAMIYAARSQSGKQVVSVSQPAVGAGAISNGTPEARSAAVVGTTKPVIGLPPLPAIK